MLVASSRAWFRLPNSLVFSVRKLPDLVGRKIVDQALKINLDPLSAADSSYLALETGYCGDKAVKRLMRHFPNPMGNIKYYEATVKVGSDSVGFIYLFPAKQKGIVEKLTANLRSSLKALDKAMFVVYRSGAYSAVDPEGSFFKSAIMTRIPPPVLCLLTEL